MPRPRAIEDEILLPKVVKLFWRNGYARTGVRELESELGLKAPSLYHRFGSKQALFEAALAHYIDSVVGWRIAHYLQAEDPMLGLRQFFDSTYDSIGKRGPGIGCLLVNTSLELNECGPKVDAQLQRGARLIHAALRATLLRAQRQGSLDAAADVDALADSLHLALQGILVSTRRVRDPQRLRRTTDHLFASLRLMPQKRGTSP